MRFELPKEALAYLLINEFGVTKFYGNLQEAALNILNRNYKLALKEKLGKLVGKFFGIDILLGKGNNKAEALVIRKDGAEVKDELMFLLENKPRIVVWVDYKMNEKELRKLAIQLNFTLASLRNYLWDRHLYIENVNEKFRGLLERYVPLRNVNVNSINAEYLTNAVVLDPYAEEDLTSEDVLRYDTFIFGGIVDFGNRLKGETKSILEGLPHKRISLRGSIVGVPDRLNILTNIILYTRYYSFDLEKSIKKFQPHRDARVRCLIEIQRTKRRDLEFYDELKEWLNLRLKDYLWCLNKLKSL